MTEVNLFEVASKRKFRFVSSRGALTVEQLWDLQLLASHGPDACDLNNVAKAVNEELKSVSEESFVEVRANARRTELEQKLEIVKYIIAQKQAEIAAAEKARTRMAEREKLITALAAKQDAKLGAMTEDEIRKRLDELDAA